MELTKGGVINLISDNIDLKTEKSLIISFIKLKKVNSPKMHFSYKGVYESNNRVHNSESKNDKKR